MRLNSIAEQTKNRMGQLSRQSAQAHYLDLVEESACPISPLLFSRIVRIQDNKQQIYNLKKKKKRVIGDLLKVSIATYSSTFLIKLPKV